MNQYDIRNHVLLSDATKALQPEVVEAYAEVAEGVLGLAGTAFTGAQADLAANAVALQVNFMVARPVDPYLTGHTRGAESKSWAAAAAGGGSGIDPIAGSIADGLLDTIDTGVPGVAGSYFVLTSLR